MAELFEPVTIGTLTIRNRMMRSATAERVANPQDGTPSAKQQKMYVDLAEGGIGLIVTGHAYVERQGKGHPEMASMATDAVIPAWRDVITPAQQAGARIIAQINHCGASCDPKVTLHPLSPAGVATNPAVQPQAMTADELDRIIRAFGQAARRVQEAGFDGVQIHGAHGYLLNQFMTPLTYPDPCFLLDGSESDDVERRSRILKAVTGEIRQQVGDDFPVWIKLGVAGREDSGLDIRQGARFTAACFHYGVDCVELSHGLGTPSTIDERGPVAYLPFAEAVRPVVGEDVPLALVHSFSTVAQMQSVLDRGLVQMVSMCRPLIAEPDLPAKLRADTGYAHACTRCGQCWPKERGMGVACYNQAVQRKLGE
ncbi:MAG: NADH:flavin oxidoreductase [Anaerolineae bacterium]|nr:NADH:flavin oxidoreductase [Anaerolineae bacterium]